MAESSSSKVLKVGLVTLTNRGERSWSIRYRCPQSNRDIRRRLEGLSRSEALQIAAHVSATALSEKGYLPGKPQTLPSIHDALAETIKLSRQRPYIKKDSARRAGLFERYLEENFKKVKTWDQLLPSTIVGYAREMEEKGLAPDSIKNNLKPVKAAWKRMSENYPDQVRPLPTIRINVPPPRKVETLSAFEVSAYLDYLQVKDRYLHAFETVRFECGLRMLEAAALRLRDIDFERWLLTVTETPEHKPKTPSSYRTIQMTEEAVTVLKDWVADMKAIPIGGELFRNKVGLVWTADGIGKRVKKAMRKAAKALQIPRLGSVRPHCLRATCATFASRLGVPDRLVMAYIGHTGETMLARHYQGVEDSELKLVSNRLDHWRSLVWQSDSGKMLAIEMTDEEEVLENKGVKPVQP